MIRYLNFAHLLLLTDAQSKETSEYALSPAQKLARFLRRGLFISLRDLDVLLDKY
jgi:hypothetical protein